MISKTSLNTNQNDKVIDLYDTDLEFIYSLQNNFMSAFYIISNLDEETFDNIGYIFVEENYYKNQTTGEIEYISNEIAIADCKDLSSRFETLNIIRIKAFPL